MLEQNTFRSMMLIGGLMTLAIMVGAFFAMPSVYLDEQAKHNYEAIMQVDLGDDDYELTMYQALVFNMQARAKARVRQH